MSTPNNEPSFSPQSYLLGINTLSGRLSWWTENSEKSIRCVLPIRVFCLPVFYAKRCFIAVSIILTCQIFVKKTLLLSMSLKIIVYNLLKKNWGRHWIIGNIFIGIRFNFFEPRKSAENRISCTLLYNLILSWYFFIIEKVFKNNVNADLQNSYHYSNIEWGFHSKDE